MDLKDCLVASFRPSEQLQTRSDG